nr:MAG TPA: hypothetical protein [Caudoviricetes sp.]
MSKDDKDKHGATMHVSGKRSGEKFPLCNYKPNKLEL